MNKQKDPQNISGPARTCISCLTKKNKYELYRFVLQSDGSVILDRKQNIPGRGAYTCPNTDCLENAIKKNQFDRVFRQKTFKKSFSSLRKDFTACLKTRSEH